jgi:aspartyl aminopeptidase
MQVSPIHAITAITTEDNTCKVCWFTGKYGTSDANGEFFARLASLLDSNNVKWQTGEMGKVDAGGGGTIAKFLAHLGMEVIDCGVPVLSMHSTFEITSKIDVYYTHLAYQAFLRDY